jgi:hypothetical protein
LTRVGAFLFILLFTVSHRAAASDSITLAWDASPHPQTKGYLVYVGLRPGDYTKTVDAGRATSYTLVDAQPGQQYCFAVAVYTISALVSAKSREVCGFSDEPPQLTHPGDQVTAPGTAVLLALKGSDPEGKPVTYAAAGLPPGLTLRADTGVIAGTSTVVGTYSVSVTASDGRLSSVQSFAWRIGDGPTAPPPSDSDTVLPSSGTGAAQTFTLRYSIPAGTAGLEAAWVWFRSTSTVALANSCVARYDSATRSVSLLDDDATRWFAGTIAQDTTLKNTNCSIAMKGASAVAGSSALTINLPMTFAPAFGGPKNVDMYSTAFGGLVSAWRTRGTWAVPGKLSVAVMGLQTATISGVPSYRVAVQASSAGEGTALTNVGTWFVLAGATSAANSCRIRFDLRTRSFALLNNKGTAWTEGQLGTKAALLNGQCTIPLDQSSIVLQTQDSLTMILTVSFTSTFKEQKTIYLDAISSAGTSSGWTTRTGWVVK